MKKAEMKDNMICLCERCIEGIRSHGEKIWELEPIDDFDDFDLDEGDVNELPICEWCEEENYIEENEYSGEIELIHDELIVCIFP